MKKSALSSMGERSEAPPISWLMEIALSRPELISLAAGFTDSESLPVKDVRRLIEEVLSRKAPARAALQYGSTAGDLELRRLIAQAVEKGDTGKTCGALRAAYAQEKVVVTNGSQQLLYLVTEALCDPGDIVLVEDPTYFVYLGIAQSRGLDCRGISMQEDGLDLDRLAAVLESLKDSGDLPRVKMLYLVTYFQNPSGITTRFAKKAAALQLLRRYEKAAGHPIYLLEDAAYRHLRFKGSDEKSALAARGFADRVIYTSTYSKPFATGIRVGYGILPQPIYTVVLRLKGNHDFGTANLLQQLIKRAITSGRLAKQVEEIQELYGRKARVMLKALRKYFPPRVHWVQPAGGLYVWVRLPESISSGPQSKLFEKSLDNNVLYVPGSLCYAEDATRPKPDCEMRLSFGNASAEDIRKGIKRLGRVVEDLMG